MADAEPRDLDALAELLLKAGAPVGRGDASRLLGGWAPCRLEAAAAGLKAFGAQIDVSASSLRLRLNDPLEKETIQAGLSNGSTVAVDVCRICTSTNERVRQAVGWHVCAAEAQSAGRGRRGRAWEQPFGSGLAFSIGGPAPGAAPAGLAIAVAVVLVEELTAAGYVGLGLKWPNDIYAHGGKLGGVLVEMLGGAQPRVIVGIGLNVWAAPAVAGRQTARLSDLGPSPERSRLGGRLASAVLYGLREFDQVGFSVFARRFSRFDILSGQAVRLHEASGAIDGVAKGVAPDGSIIVEAGGRWLRRSDAEVTLGPWRGA